MTDRTPSVSGDYSYVPWSEGIFLILLGFLGLLAYNDLVVATLTRVWKGFVSTSSAFSQALCGYWPVPLVLGALVIIAAVVARVRTTS